MANSYSYLQKKGCLLLLPLLFFTAGAATAVEVPAVSDAAVFTAVANGEFKDFEISNLSGIGDDDNGYFVSTFEPPNICADFGLTEIEVREFFKKAHFVIPASREAKKIDRDGGSRCRVDGSFVLQNGKKIDWSIDRARIGTLTFSAEPGNSGWPFRYVLVYCDTCQDARFYAPKGEKGKQLSDYRPIVKSVTVDVKRKKDMYVPGPAENMPPEDVSCRKFKLSKADVLEFFRISRPSCEIEYKNDAFDTYGNTYCVESGQAILQNGQTASWRIEKTRIGVMHFSDGSKPQYFYCKDCPAAASKYDEECDIECFRRQLDER